MSRLSPKDKAERIRRLRWGPTDPRARLRWWRLANRVGARVFAEGAEDMRERFPWMATFFDVITKGGAR